MEPLKQIAQNIYIVMPETKYNKARGSGVVS